LFRRKGDGRRGIANVSKGRDEESETLIGYQDLHLPIGFDFKNMYRYKKRRDFSKCTEIFDYTDYDTITLIGNASFKR